MDDGLQGRSLFLKRCGQVKNLAAMASLSVFDLPSHTAWPFLAFRARAAALVSRRAEGHPQASHGGEKLRLSVKYILHETFIHLMYLCL
jgi:hypothetical protein